MRQGSLLLTDFCLCLAFFSRLSCPFAEETTGPASLHEFSRAARMVPLAGAAIGALAAALIAAASALGLPAPVVAPLAIAALAAISGAMHEDGLADCADGFFGGAKRDEKLAIMRDSRIGVFGTLTLLLALYLRAASLAVIAQDSLPEACAVLIGAAAFSRTGALVPLTFLPPARQAGAGFAAGKPNARAVAIAVPLAGLLAMLPVLMGATLSHALAGIGLAAGSAYGVTWLAKRHIGGQTGDVAGAAQQLSEIAYYLSFAARS